MAGYMDKVRQFAGSLCIVLTVKKKTETYVPAFSQSAQNVKGVRQSRLRIHSETAFASCSQAFDRRRLRNWV